MPERNSSDFQGEVERWLQQLQFMDPQTLDALGYAIGRMLGNCPADTAKRMIDRMSRHAHQGHKEALPGNAE